MWNLGMYEWMANERIATYQREAVRDRLGVAAAADAGKVRAAARGAAMPEPGMRSGRLGLAAAFIGLAAASALRRRR